jgi:hypothetical protein
MIDFTKLEKVKTSGDIELENKQLEAQAYLTSTDWYVVRFFETQEAIPSEVSGKRAEARATLSTD